MAAHRTVTTIVFIVWAALTCWPGSVVGQSAEAPGELPAEELRLSPGVFRAGLKKLGLHEVLELHLRDFPPADEVDRLLMLRDIRMAEFMDASLPRRDRRAAAEEANAVLERLMREYPEDARRFEWAFELARSLIYDQAASALTRLLYRESRATGDEALAGLTERAVALTGQLLGEIDREYKRIDALDPQAFDALERDGSVERLDRLVPRTHYLRAWALFYDSVHRSDDHPRKAAQLNELRDYLRDHPGLLTTPHEESHVQVQALLLAGMTARALQDHATCREVLRQAIAVAESLEPSEQARVGWALSLAWLELGRSLRDAQQFDKAMAAQANLVRLASDGGPAGFGLRLAGALLERSIWQARAALAEAGDDAGQARRFRTESWQAVVALIEREPDRRDEVYAVIYDSLDPQDGWGQLDPVELCAAVAGLLNEAANDSGSADERLVRARSLAEAFLSRFTTVAPGLTPQVLFNLAVVHMREGNAEEAARRFFELARDYPTFEKAYLAATAAVQLHATLAQEASDGARAGLRAAYRAALELLLRQYPGSEAEGYWRFFYAQLLSEGGEHAAAAAQFALVDPAHEHYLESVFLRLHELALDLHRHVEEQGQDEYGIRNRADQLSRLEREFSALVAARSDGSADSAHGALIRDMVARARVIRAEVMGLPQVNQPEAAVEMLKEFESRFPDQSDLLGRVWRVRLLSLERLGRLDEAVDAIPDYVRRDAAGAGVTLQSLFDAMRAEVEVFRGRGDEASAQSKASIAVLLAQQLKQWAALRGAELDDAQANRISLKLGQALLTAGRFADARTELEALALQVQASGAGGVKDGSPMSPRLAVALAESRFQTEAYEAALPVFNKLATELDPDEPIRWQALLRDLQCRTQLGEPAEDIIKVIRQQQYLFPELGGARWSEGFAKLLRENQRRVDAAKP